MLSFSVIVNTYNRGAFLPDTLQSLSELDYSNYEVIVVNGPSTDNTQEVLSHWKDIIKIGDCPEPNLSMSRNIGIQMASGDIVAFIDDDAAPHPSWLKHLAVNYLDPRVGGVGGFTIDNTGVRYQVKKTICDRFGNAINPNDYFDERPLCQPGTPYYPSLLGTNCSFRRGALQEIGGFDHAFAYFLDETDVCLRLTDRGYRIVYEPDALVYHQFAASHIRGKNRIPKSLYLSSVSKAYFIYRHGASFSEERANEEISKYQTEIIKANKWLCDYHDISLEHRTSLDDDVLFGLREGRRLGVAKRLLEDTDQGQLDKAIKATPFLKLKKKKGLRIVFVSRSLPPNVEAGIARWTWMMATGLAARGHAIHIITSATEAPSTRYQDGYWVHAIQDDESEEALAMAAQKAVPKGLAGWCYAVHKTIDSIKSFGIDVVSFPIWDLEGMLLLDDDSLNLVMSLHTTYALAKPFKKEWLQRPLFGHFLVDRVIDAEKVMLTRVKHILANSNAIVADIEKTYGIEISQKCLIAAHGTTEPIGIPTKCIADKIQAKSASEPIKVTYVGRFENRKGFDLACDGLRRVLEQEKNIEVHFAGNAVTEEVRVSIASVGGQSLLNDDRVTFHGVVSREELDRLYVQSDICLMPSRYESFGLVAIEAMAAGSVVIALNAGGLAEVVEHSRTGYLLPETTVDGREISEKILELAKDRALLGTMKKLARATFEEKYTIEAMVTCAEPLYIAAGGRKCN